MWLMVWMSCAVLADVIGSRQAVIRDVLQEVLHITPPGMTSASPLPAAPRHMLELYQKYMNGGRFGSVATTVRNILPQLATGGEELMVFNVSSVRGWEEVRLAELQLNRRRLSQRHPPPGRLLVPPLRVRLYRWSPNRLTSLASVPLAPARRNGWVIVDITTPLKELLLDPRTSRHLLALKFESPTGKVIPPSHFLRGVPYTPYAFLVVSSEDSDENQVTEDGMRPSPRPPMHTHALVQKLQQGKHGHLFMEEDNSMQIIPTFDNLKQSRILDKYLVRRKMLNTTKQPLPTPTPKTFNSDGAFNQNEFSSVNNKKPRLLRSIVDNQLMDARDDVVGIQPAKSSSLQKPLLTTNTALFNYSDDSRKKIKRNKKNKRKKNKKIKDEYHDILQNRYKDPEEGCTIRQMTVNFAELGWGEWIVSPDKFDANYCTGSCRFPLTKALSPSNHATLQSLVHALGRDPLVPAPACVPQRMSAITLLYFDETLNVVLKNYPSMVVDTCACH